MKQKNITSIILPIWLPYKDKEQYVKWTLQSLAKTTDSNFELIIYNDQSTAKSRKFITKHIEQLKSNHFCVDIKVFGNKKNIGWTGAWDFSIRKATGKYVCIINDDIILEDSWLSKMLKHVKGDVGAVGPTSNFVSGRQNVKHNSNVTEEKVNFLIGFCFLATREALDAVYNKQEDYYIDPIFFPGGSEELDLCLRLSRAGYDMVIARDVFVHHFGNRSLNHLVEFVKSQNDFYNRRLQLLTKKYSREEIDVLDSSQLCPKIAIGIPTIGQIDAMFLAMYPWILQEAWSKFGFNMVVPIISVRNLTHLGRNEIVKRAIWYGSEYLWQIDDDMLIQSDVLPRLYAHQKDFVSALAYCRIAPYSPCIYKGKDKNGKWLSDVRVRKGLIEVDTTGLSCALIKMSVIKQLLKKKNKEISERGGLFYFSRFGEDMNFTEELKKDMGIKIFVDSDIIIKHLGNRQIVSDETFFNYVKQQQLNAKQYEYSKN